MSSDAKTVRGLSIAIIILSAIGILFVLLGFAGLAWFDMLASDPSFVSELNDAMQATANSSSPFDDDYESYRLIASMDATTVVSIFVTFGGVLLGLGAACIVVSLVSGILGVKNCERREKTGAIFGWMIAGAILALLSGRFITMVLTIIAAVYANRLKKAPAAQPAPAQGCYQQPYPYQQAPYSYNQQPYRQQPGNPSQPYGYAQPPANPGQPADPGAQPYAQQPYGQQPSASRQPYGEQSSPEQQQSGEQPAAMLNGQPYDLEKQNDANADGNEPRR